MDLKTYCAGRGRKSDLAQKTGISQAFIGQIARGMRPLPVHHAAAIEMATDGMVTRQEMFPDNWHLIWPELAEKKG